MKVNKICPTLETIFRKYITVMIAFRFIIQNLKSLFIYRLHWLYYCNSGKKFKQYVTCAKITA